MNNKNEKKVQELKKVFKNENWLESKRKIGISIWHELLIALGYGVVIVAIVWIWVRWFKN